MAFHPSIDLNDAAMLVALADCPSMSVAAERLGLTKSTLSRRLARLEQRLGIPLALRNSRHLRLTEEGLGLAKRCGPHLDELTQVFQQFQADKEHVGGRLRISTPVGIGNHLIKNHLPEFLSRYPHVDVDLVLCNENRHLYAEKFDLVLRLGPLTDSSLQAISIQPLPFCLVAAPTIHHRDPPRHPMELTQCPCIIPTPKPGHQWPFRNPANGEPFIVRAGGRLAVNELQAAVHAAKAGLGFAYLPRFGVAPLLAEGNLVEHLGEWLPEPPRLLAVFPASAQRSKARDQLIAFLRERHVLV